MNAPQEIPTAATALRRGRMPLVAGLAALTAAFWSTGAVGSAHALERALDAYPDESQTQGDERGDERTGTEKDVQESGTDRKFTQGPASTNTTTLLVLASDGDRTTATLRATNVMGPDARVTIHEGTCSDVGSTVARFTDIQDGPITETVDVPVDELLEQDHVVVRASSTQMGDESMSRSTCTPIGTSDGSDGSDGDGDGGSDEQ